MLQAAEPGEQRALVELVRDPVRFTRGCLRQNVWARQAAVLQAIATGRRVAVKACHASGKTFVSAAAAVWWVTRYRDGIVITTAPTWEQVRRVLWGEIHKAVASSRIAYPALNETELKLGPTNYAIGLSTNEGVRFQGFHGQILIIVDEAPGVKPEIWEAIEGIRAGGDVRVLALGNPTISSGPFYDAFTSNREGWKTFTISAFDTPNLQGLTLESLLRLPDAELDRNVCPYLVTRRWVREKHSEWGPGHPLWEARVLGQFPTQADNALISLAWLEDAARREVVAMGGPLHAGLDVAGPGEDETVLAIVDGASIIALHVWAQSDPRGEVAAALAPYKARIEKLNVDSAGIGYYMGKHLEDLGYPVRDINVGQTASDAEKYANQRAEYYWGLRLRFQEGAVAGLTDERTVSQPAGILYKHDARGRIVIESKEDAAKRGVKSPDRAEAIMLAFACKPLDWIVLDMSEQKSKRERSHDEMHPEDQQIAKAFPFVYEDPLADGLTCGQCQNRVMKKRGNTEETFCGLRLFFIRDADPACEVFQLKY